MKTKYLLLLMLTIPLFVHAQTQMTLQQCREMSMSGSPLLKQGEQQIEAAASAVDAARKDYYPQLDINGDYTYLQDPITIEVGDMEFQGENSQYSLNAALIQNIWKGGMVRNMHNLSSYQLNLAKRNKDAIEDIVLYQTELYFWNAIYMEDLLELSGLYKEVIDDLVKVVRNKVEGELVNRSDLLLVEVRQNEAELSTMKAADSYEIALLQLKKVMGISIDSLIRPNGELDAIGDFKADRTTVESLNLRPEMAAQKEVINIKESEVALTSSKYGPNIYAGIVPVWGAPNNRLPGDEPVYNTTLVAGLNIPIVRWGKKRNEVSEMKFRKEAEVYNMEELHNQIVLEVKSAQYQLTEAVSRVELTTESMIKAEENLEMMTDRYKEGLTSILEVLDAQIYWQRAYRNMLDAQAYYQSSLSEYKKATGII